MIYQRYLIKNILATTSVTLIVLTCISAFLTFVSQLGDIGTNDYGFYQAIEYVILKIPAQVVFSLPVSVFIGAILSLGSMAENNEIVVMQASGMSIMTLITIVLKAALVIAILSVGMQQWVISETETRAIQGRSAAKKGLDEYSSKKAIWIKENNRVIHVKQLDTKGFAQGIQMFEINENRKLETIIKAKTAEATEEGWLLREVKKSSLDDHKIITTHLDTLLYSGELSVKLLKSMRLAPFEMSLTDLYQYQKFLGDNGLENEAEEVMFWRRAYSPITILITCSLAIPFVLGSQRGGQSGQRIMIGIMIGLSFVAIDRLVVRICQYFGVIPQISTLIPALLFLALNVYLLRRSLNKK